MFKYILALFTIETDSAVELWEHKYKTKGLSSMLNIFNEISNRIGISYFNWNAIPN